MVRLAEPTLGAVLRLLHVGMPVSRCPYTGPWAKRAEILPPTGETSCHDGTTPRLPANQPRHTRYGMSPDGRPSRGRGTTYVVAPSTVNRSRRRRRTAPAAGRNRPKGGKPPLGGGRGGIPPFLPFPRGGKGPGVGGGVVFAKRIHGCAPQARTFPRRAAPDGISFTCTQVTKIPLGAVGGRPPGFSPSPPQASPPGIP